MDLSAILGRSHSVYSGNYGDQKSRFGTIKGAWWSTSPNQERQQCADYLLQTWESSDEKRHWTLFEWVHFECFKEDPCRASLVAGRCGHLHSRARYWTQRSSNASLMLDLPCGQQQIHHRGWSFQVLPTPLGELLALSPVSLGWSVHLEKIRVFKADSSCQDTALRIMEF